MLEGSMDQYVPDENKAEPEGFDTASNPQLFAPPPASPPPTDPWAPPPVAPRRAPRVWVVALLAALVGALVGGGVAGGFVALADNDGSNTIFVTGNPSDSVAARPSTALAKPGDIRSILEKVEPAV